MTTRAPELPTAHEPAVRRISAGWRWALIALGIAGLFFVYWRESLSAAANSDSAAISLLAWDMLHGNWLLHGWWLADVSFYTTEVPQYALLELIGGLGPWVVHVAAAMTYTLIVVLTALVAQGPQGPRGPRGPRVRGASPVEGWARALLAGAIVASPQASGVLIFLLGPDHTGTMVPVLAIWLLIDRAQPRWWVPVLVGFALTWIMVADSVVLLTVIAPLIIAVVIRAVRAVWADQAARGDRAALGDRSIGQRRYELMLALAAAVAAGLGLLIPKLIVRLGGFQFWRFQTHTMPLSKLPRDAWNTTRAVLQFFGADVFSAHPGLVAVLVSVHLAGFLLALAGLVIAVARFFREDSILIPALAVAIVVQLGVFLVSIHSQNLASTREIVGVLPSGAVLAGRLLAGPLLRFWGASAGRAWRSWRAWSARQVLFASVASVLVAGYLGAMLYGAAQPSIPSANQGVAGWLAGHGLTDGLGGYWQADSITLDTNGKVRVSSVDVDGSGRIAEKLWETDTTQYDPARHTATFVVAGGPASVGPVHGLANAAIRTFGRPAHTYHIQGYTILVWNHNILRDLR